VTVAADDRALVARFLSARDEEAFLALYRGHAAGVYGMALRLCGGVEAEAQDVAQEAWVRAVRLLPSFRWTSALKTWICGIAVNVWRERRRALGRGEGLPSVEVAEPAAFEDAGARLDLSRAVAGLPAGSREILLLHDVEGYTHKEIAGLLEIEEGTSKSQLSRARASLRAALVRGIERKPS
jgi:RNA polymerase sigma-70 factor (ECF subfamily)